MMNIKREQIIKQLLLFIKDNKNCSVTFVYKNFKVSKNITNYYIQYDSFSCLSSLQKVIRVMREDKKIICSKVGRNVLLRLA